MTPSMLVYLLVVGGLVALSASALDVAMRRSGLPTRWAWVAALGALVVFAVASPRRMPVGHSLAVLPQVQDVASSAPLASTSTVAMMFQRGQQWADVALGAAFTAVDASVPRTVTSMIVIAWMAASALVLVLLVCVHGRMARARRQWPTTELHGTRVRLAPLAGPAVIGVTRPEIVMPRWLLERDVDEQRLVLAHEREHVAARDHLLPIGAWLVAAAMPWHPAVWWMMARLRLAMELDCDARVLRHGDVKKYGLLLIDIAGRYGGHRTGALALADRSSHLERRLKAMTTTKSRFATARACALAAVAGLSLLAACEARLPTTAEVESMDAASAKRIAVAGKMLAKDGPVFYVNGVKVTEAEANAIPSGDVATVNVVKGERGGEGEIRIMTKLVQGDGGKVAYRIADTTVGPVDKARIRVRGTADVNGSHSREPFTGLVYVNGVLSSNTVFESMNPESIKSVEVLKGAAAAALSNDPAAANGIIRITTKSRQ